MSRHFKILVFFLTCGCSGSTWCVAPTETGGTGGASAMGGVSATGGISDTGGIPATGGVSAMGDAGSTCVTDLSGIGTGDFRITFTVTTTATGLTMPLAEQLAACIVCGESGAGWAVTMTPTGAIEIDTSDGTPNHSVFTIGGGPVNDGLPHQVAVGRTHGMLWVRTDGGQFSQLSPAPYRFGALPPLTVGLVPCSSSACWPYQQLRGSVSNICATRLL